MPAGRMPVSASELWSQCDECGEWIHGNEGIYDDGCWLCDLNKKFGKYNIDRADFSVFMGIEEPTAHDNLKLRKDIRALRREINKLETIIRKLE